MVKFNDDAILFDLLEIDLQLEKLLDAKVDVISENRLKDTEIERNIKICDNSIGEKLYI